jgi:peptidoglycan/xylan/chitin deacetylase (PgdA/CDA1 family)
MVLDRFKKAWGPRICSWIPPRVWHRILNVELILPYWHSVGDKELDHISGDYRFRSLEEFKGDLAFFLRYFKPVSLDQIVDHLNGSSSLPQRCFLPTFDDGFRESHDAIAPLLAREGLPAAFFLVTSTIDNRELGYLQKKSMLLRRIAEKDVSNLLTRGTRILDAAGVFGPDLDARIRAVFYRKRELLDKLGVLFECDFAEYLSANRPYLTSDQIISLMKQGFDIGAHSIDHPLYSEISLEEQLNQTLGSVDWLSAKYNFKCRAFSFPYHDSGISLDFFARVFGEPRLEVTFGGGGIVASCHPRNMPRFTMERTSLPASQVLARQYGKALLHRLC